MVLSISDRGVLKSPNIIVGSCISPCNSTSFASCSLTQFLDTYTLGIVMFSWRIYHYHYEMPFLFLITFPALKSALSEINIAISAFFYLMLAWHTVLYTFAFNLYVLLYLKWVFFRLHIYSWSYFWSALTIWLDLYILTLDSLSDYWYSWINIYHICYCFLLVALILCSYFCLLHFFCLSWF